MSGHASNQVPGLALAPKTVIAPSELKAILRPAQYWPEQVLSDSIAEVEARGKSILHVMQPDLVTEILTDNKNLFAKHAIYRKIAGAESGPQSMIATEGRQAWDAKKEFGSLLTQSQSTKHIPMIREVTIRLSNDLAENGKDINISALLAAITFEIIWRVMFDPNAISAPLPDFVRSNITQIFQARMTNDHRRVTALISDTAVRSIEMAKSCPHMNGSSFIINKNSSLSADAMLDNIRLFLSAGHKTSALAVAWTLWLLARSPESEKTVRAELEHAVGHDLKTYEGTPFTKAALTEAMRLLPPAVMTVRQSRQDTKIGDYDIVAGTPIIINFYAMHRHKTLWPDPDVFRPSRFLYPHVQDIVTGSYRPFSAGAHVCLGTKFAELESIIILSELLRQFDFTVGKADPKPVYSFTLHAWDGVPLTARARMQA